MSVPFGIFRRAVREPSFRATPGNGAGAAITPIGTFRRAVCTYHSDGAQAAVRGLTLRSDYWRRPGRGRTLATNYRNSLRTYIRLDQADGRSYFDCGVKEVVALGDQTLSVYIDSFVYDIFGHGARVALWDRPVPSQRDAAVIGAPVGLALAEVVGEERSHDVAIWHLRSGRVFQFAIDEVLSHVDLAIDAVRRAAGA